MSRDAGRIAARDGEAAGDNLSRGLGATVEIIAKLIADDPETLAKFRDLTTAGKGRPKAEPGNGDIITIKPERGTSRAYTLARLRDDRPDLFAKVRAREVSANAAAPPLAEHGEIGNGRSRGDIITSTERGTSRLYLVRKLKRDAPEFAERLAAGEFPSARAAAIAAGIIHGTDGARSPESPSDSGEFRATRREGLGPVSDSEREESRLCGLLARKY